ncbi:MAG: LamG domain-containing protein, partial [Armatimonadetes bacterium]|nr:LamG domain-containing protein [Armatimonadota bacterium]
MTRFLFVFTPLLLISVAFAQDGPVGSWSFDEGRGEVVADLSGHGNTGKVHGASFITRGGGFALSFDGRDDYVDCGAGESLNLTEAITLEAWVKPTGLSRGEPMILGKFFDSYALTQYQGNKLWFYISGGGNKVWSQGVPLAQWQHVVATFDARSPAGAGQMKPYLNRRLVGAKTSPKDRIAPGKHFFLGALITDPGATDPGYPGTSFWQGELDDVRVYGRALSEAEIGERYRQTAGGYGVDTRWFDKLRLVAWPDAVGRQVTVLADASGIAPRPPETTLRLSLLAADESAAQPPREFSKLPPSGKVGCVVDLQGLARGR